MRFGSVEFFKVLIKVVLAIFFFVPLALAIVFGIFWAKQGGELAEVKKENEKLSATAQILTGEKAGTIDDFCAIFSKSGLSYTEFIKQMNENKEITAESFYKLLTASGLSDKDLLKLIVKKDEIGAGEFYEILSQNGISDKDLISAIAKKNGGKNWYGILSELGLSDREIVDYLNEKNGWTNSVEVNVPEKSPYADIHTDMYVTAPANYVREENTVYLTFDDGPSDNTYSILQYLRDYDIKATFFVVPNRSEYCYTMLKAIAADGHAIGIHSASHKYDEIYASVENYLDDFYDAWNMVYEATGIKCEIFRFPGGSLNDYNTKTRDDIIAEMSRRGFRHFDWSVDSGDAVGASWTQMWNSVPADIKANYDKNFRSVVLMHDSDSTTNTVLVLGDLLKKFTSEGVYKFDKINNDTQPVQFAGPFA